VPFRFQQLIKNRICILSPPPKRIKHHKNPEKAQEYDEHIHHLQNPNRFSTTQSTQIRVKFLINFTIQQQISPRTNQTVSNSQSIASRFNKIVSNFRDSQRFFKESSSSNLRILPAIPTVR
jgi:hypothetical protein